MTSDNVIITTPRRSRATQNMCLPLKSSFEQLQTIVATNGDSRKSLSKQGALFAEATRRSVLSRNTTVSTPLNPKASSWSSSSSSSGRQSTKKKKKVSDLLDDALDIVECQGVDEEDSTDATASITSFESEAIVTSPRLSFTTRRNSKQQRPSRRCHEQKQRRSTTKVLKFSKHDLIYEIPHIDDLSDTEVCDVWHTEDEMLEIKRNAKAMLKLISTKDDGTTIFSSNADEEEKINTIRGLDQHLSSYHQKSEACRSLIYETVAKLQPFKQRKNLAGDIDSIIADLYSKYSKTSSLEAIERAKCDRSEAQQIYYEEVFFD